MQSDVDAAFLRFSRGWLATRDLPESHVAAPADAARFSAEALAAYVEPGTSPEDLFDAGNSRPLGGSALAYCPDTDTLGRRTLYVASARYGPVRRGISEGWASFRQRASAGLPLLGMPRAGDSLVWVVLSQNPLTAEESQELAAVQDDGASGYESFEAVGVSLRDLMRREYGRPPFVRATLRFRRAPEPDRSGGAVLGTVSLTDLHAFMREYESESGDINLLYSENIRLEQGASRINRGMRETLREKPERFGLYNNGVTIIADAAEANGRALVLRGASVINGCQTTRSVFNVFRDAKDPVFDELGQVRPEKEGWYATAEDTGFVMVKVVLAGGDDDDLVYRVTKYANSQNAIGAAEMLGQNEFLSGLQAGFRVLPEGPVYVEVKQGGWAAEKQVQSRLPERFRTPYADSITAKELLKAAAAVHLAKPGPAMQGVSRLVPGNSAGRQAAAMGELSVRDYYAAYRVLRSLESQGISFSGRDAGHWSQTRWLSCFLLADAVIRLCPREGDRSQSLLAALDGWAGPAFTEDVASELGSLYSGYLVPGGDPSFFSDSGNSDRNAFLRTLDGERLPEGLGALWSAALARMGGSGEGEEEAVDDA